MVPSERYDRASIALHWLTLALLIGVYACIELRELFPRGSDARAALKTWHFMLGLTVFTVVWIRLLARVFGKTPPIVPSVPRWQAAIATMVEFSLYALLIALPVLGWITLSAEGKVIPFFGLELPALVQPNKEFGHRMEDLHTTLGTAGYYLVGIHAAAALFHHYVRHDNTLLRMLPSRR
jgi:cytochrome b561